MRFVGKVAIVTGGSRGIGRAIVERLTQEGAATVFTFSASHAEAESLQQKIEGAGGKAMAIRADVSSLEAANQVASQAEETFGKIDILVNNAGITRDKSLMLMTQAEWAQVMDTNLTGVFNYSKAVIMKMFRQGSGDIVNISSYSGVRGAIGQTNYSASKSGMIGFTKALAREVAPSNIRVNAVAPGFIETDMLDGLPPKHREMMLRSIPLGRFGTPEEVAGAVLYLLSEEAAYITGQVIQMDGGLGI